MGTKFKGSAKQVLALEAFITLMRAQSSVMHHMTSRSAFGDLTPSQFGVMESLLHLGPLTQKALAGKILRSPGNLVMVIDNLVKAGLVRKERSTTDRRVIEISLTPSGREKIKKQFPRHATHVQEAMATLTQKELKELKALCRKLGVGLRLKESAVKAN
jgi:MarR family 2-MHQ and catechol resistance regulon transcriptional repressor